MSRDTKECAGMMYIQGMHKKGGNVFNMKAVPVNYGDSKNNLLSWLLKLCKKMKYLRTKFNDLTFKILSGKLLQI